MLDGTFRSTYSTTIAATYAVAVEYDGLAISGSPFSMAILPGRVSTGHCTASGDGLATAIAGSGASFNIFARDEYGNLNTEGESRPTAAIPVVNPYCSCKLTGA